ncbi:MAG: methyltransferase domain-containing protein [Opitutaceae bacterium]
MHADKAYTPGYSDNAVDFMLRRTVESHGAFILPYLRTGLTVLDCGCGPGSITRSIASHVPDGKIVGVDFSESQISAARGRNHPAGSAHVSFQTASAYDLPFAGGTFDIVFSHALLEHLSEPARAVAEFKRVLKGGGTLGVCSPDWGGFLLAPTSQGLVTAIEDYKKLQIANGGDVHVGRQLGKLLLSAGFLEVKMDARYEVYPSVPLIAEYLALQLDKNGLNSGATALRAWMHEPSAMFAQSWISCVGRKG